MEESKNPVLYIRPTAVLSLFENYQRRSEIQQDRVVGALIGRVVDLTGSLDICTAFTVPHSEIGDQVSLNVDYLKTRFELLSKAQPNEYLIGWYVIGKEIGPHAAFIHDAFARESVASLPKTYSLPVIAFVHFDPLELQGDILMDNMRMFYSSAKSFNPMPVSASLVGSASQRALLLIAANAVAAQKRSFSLPNRSELQEMQKSQIEPALKIIQKYLADVKAGARQKDEKIDAELVSILQHIPELDPSYEGSHVDDGVKNNITRVTDLINLQIAITQKYI